MHEVLVNRLGGLSLHRKSVVRLTDRPAMTLDVYRGRKTTTQQQQQYLCDFKTLCFYLATVWFGRVYIAMENGRNLTEKFWEEIIMNRQLKKDFRFLLTKVTQNCRLCDVMQFCVFLCVCKLLLCSRVRASICI